MVPDADAAVGQAGLVVEWASTPAQWPGDLGNGVTLERASFAFESLRVVGDAGPGDPRTTAAGFMVRWDDVTSPPAIAFIEAPTGLYSQVSIVVDGQLGNDSFELRGRAFIDGTDWEYRIQDESPLMLTVPINATVSPPDLATVTLRVNFQHALESIDFETLDIDNGRLELESGDAQMSTFRTKLVESFQIAAP